VRQGVKKAAGVFCAAFWLTSSADAQEAVATASLEIRAGPADDYPQVLHLAVASPMHVHGCLSDWTWCDVSAGDWRGWAYAPLLTYNRDGRRWPLYAYGPALGIGNVVFSLGDYWKENYRGRPWYGEQAHWADRAPPRARPPGPAPSASLPGAGSSREAREGREPGRERESRGQSR
jgi:uncharacterized protein YraI